MAQPLVSVVTTVYNCEKFIKESIDSIISQSFRDFELILVNDGSTDGTRDICISYTSDKRVIFIDNDNNKKIPTRRNQGISYAKGRYIAIHDGDDVSLPFRLEKQVNLLEGSKSVFCVGSHAIQIDPEGNETHIMDYPPETHEQIVHDTVDKTINPMIDPTTMFNRRIFNFLGGYTLDRRFWLVPDFNLWIRALKLGFKFANIQEPLIKYRHNPSGNTLKYKREMIFQFAILWRKFASDHLHIIRNKMERKKQGTEGQKLDL